MLAQRKQGDTEGRTEQRTQDAGHSKSKEVGQRRKDKRDTELRTLGETEHSKDTRR